VATNSHDASVLYEEVVHTEALTKFSACGDRRLDEQVVQHRAPRAEGFIRAIVSPR
jgi:hypothetical protein